MTEDEQQDLSRRLDLARNKIRKIRPPLKWAGGKYKILDDIDKKLPPGKRLIEPFVGSGAVFLNSDYARYTLNDRNKDLITFYKTLKKNGQRFIEYGRQYFQPEYNQASAFYALREKFNQLEDGFERAAIFLYLNKHGYNGLCRYNASGDLNVPFGRYKNAHFPELEMLLFCEKSKRAAFHCKDFEAVMRAAKPGDVIYCDPPYVPLSDTSNFTAYHAGGFGAKEHQRLAGVSKELAERGIPVLISNHHTDFTKKIYADVKAKNKRVLSVRRLISCHGDKRGYVKEVLALYLPA